MRETRVTQVEYSREGVLRLLYGACVVCFLLGIFTIVYGELVSTIFLNLWYRALYTGSLFSIGIALFVLGVCSKRMLKQMSDHQPQPVERAQPPLMREAEVLKQEPKLFTSPTPPPPSEVPLGTNTVTSESRKSRSISGETHLTIEKYDVKHPREIVDSQC